ncbi:MAG: IS66 family transposase [Bifidobacterium pseudocatenulatum]
MRAPQPEPPIPGSFATPSLLAWIVNGKYVMSLPLYRIEADLKACGATISRQDMANWMMNVHARWLAKVHERMKVELLSHVRIHADETTVQVLKEPNREAKKKSRMWLFCSARCDVPVYVFEYHETRRKGVAQEFLAGWSGTLTTDGYKPYFNLGNPNIANTACLVPRAPLLRPNREDRRRRRQGGVCGQRCARGKAQDRRHVSRSTPSSTTWSRVPGRPPATRSSARSWRTSGDGRGASFP